MQRKGIKTMAVALLLSSVISIGSLRANAVQVMPNSLGEMNVSLDTDGRVYNYLKSIGSKSLWNYKRQSVTVGSKALSVQGALINGVYYIPFRQAASAIQGSTYSYDSNTKTATMRASGLEIVAGNGCYVTYANGRAFGHFAFECENLDEIDKKIKELGYSWEIEPFYMPEVKTRISFLLDPDNNEIELIEKYN